jgi:CubicO group peptidase (beta-lactamase class C family)
VAGGTPMRPVTVLEFCSIGKMLIVSAIMRLVKQDKLDLAVMVSQIEEG